LLVASEDSILRYKHCTALYVFRAVYDVTSDSGCVAFELLLTFDVELGKFGLIDAEGRFVWGT
jgi:hypothetical protein